MLNLNREALEQLSQPLLSRARGLSPAPLLASASELRTCWLGIAILDR